MRVVFLGKNKPVVGEGLSFLLEQGIEVAAVVVPPPSAHEPVNIGGLAREYGLPTPTDTELYEDLDRGRVSGIDVSLSLLFPRLIRDPLISLPRLGCVNFHPAPLPEFRGVAGYSVGILENVAAWGVSAHFVDATFDTGEIIEVRRFPIEASSETALSLERRTQPHLLDLFKDTLLRLQDGSSLPRQAQPSGRYISSSDFEALRHVGETESADVIERKIRAFWYPPRGGASVTIAGEEYTLVSSSLLEEIAELYRSGGRE